MQQVLVAIVALLLSACVAAENASQVTDDSPMPSSPAASATAEHGNEGQLSIHLDPGVGGEHGTVAVARLSQDDDLTKEVVAAIGTGGPPTELVTWSLPPGDYRGAVHLAGCSEMGCPDDLSSFAGPWDPQESISVDDLRDPFEPCEFTIEIIGDADRILVLRHAANEDNSCSVDEVDGTSGS